MKLTRRKSRAKSRTMRCLALCLAMVLPATIRSQAECYIDSATGQQVCPQSPESSAGVRAPSLDPRPSTLDPSAHCRIAVGDGSTGSGSLVAVNDRLGLVLTCSHLFDSATSPVIVMFPDGSRFAARLIDRDPAHDLAALIIRRPDIEPLAVSDAEPAGLLTACGFGADGQFRAFRGAIVGQATAVGAAHPALAIAGAVRPGDSGGAVLDARGRLVGIVWGQQGGLTYATCGRPVRELLDRVIGRGSRAESQGPENPSGPRRSPLDSRLADLDARLRALDARKQDKLDVGRLARRVEIAGWSMGSVIAAALGISGPLATAVVVAAALVRRRPKKRGARRGEQGVNATRPAPGSMLPAGKPIAVDTPPPPQRSVPDTRYVSVEKDSFARAHQWASEHVARKYPGASEILQAQESLIKQYLAAQ